MSHGSTRKAKPRKEWDEFLYYIRQHLGCDSRTVKSDYRVERRYLTRSMKMVVYRDLDPPSTKEMVLGYIEIHESGLVSYEYKDWLKNWANVHGEIYVSQFKSDRLEIINDFLVSLRTAGEQAISKSREKKKLEQEKIERERVKIRLEEEQRGQARKVKDAARRLRRREVDRKRREQNEIAYAAWLKNEEIRRAEQERVDAIKKKEQDELEAVKRAELEKVENRRLALLKLKQDREAKWKSDAENRRLAFAEVGIIIPPVEEVLKSLEPRPKVSWWSRFSLWWRTIS